VSPEIQNPITTLLQTDPGVGASKDLLTTNGSAINITKNADTNNIETNTASINPVSNTNTNTKPASVDTVDIKSVSANTADTATDTKPVSDDTADTDADAKPVSANTSNTTNADTAGTGASNTDVANSSSATTSTGDAKPQVQGANETGSNQHDQRDSSKLNDAIAAAGVDIQKEEELLQQRQLNRKPGAPSEKQDGSKLQTQVPLLNPYHLSAFLAKVSKTHQIHQNFLEDGNLLNLISDACEDWLSHIASKALILSRHRRRGTQFSLKKGGLSSLTQLSQQRSAVSKELRNLALRQKEMEEKRVQKRIALGLEKSSGNGTDDAANGKPGSEETLHRAANATAAMMATGKKKYSWMSSGGGGAGSIGSLGDDARGSGVGIGGGGVGGGDSKTKQSAILSTRGDNGLRYRDLRSTNAIVLKDLLNALEGEKKGTQHAITKGYAKLRD
ncbi:hypothetical protein PP707_08055, partial [Acetobacter pasteurianus]|nr:hypothetical protein [Acetobacter pasteurianus]